jgi:FixJ family two-component response regulator
MPVIVVSGEFGIEIHETIYKMGAADFIPKGRIDPADLAPRIKRFLA